MGGLLKILRMQKLEAIAEEEILARTFPGCVIGFSRGGERHLYSFGNETYESDAPAVTSDSVYDLASVTKSVTAELLHQLIDEKRISLDDPVRAHLPEYGRGDANIRHLLTYTLGNRLPLATLAERTPEAIVEAVCMEKCDPAGREFSYSNAPALLLGLIIERTLSQMFADIAAQRIFRPLRMRSATFKPRGAVPSAEGLRDIPHDESARVFARIGKAVGHAGLFASAPDLLSFLEDTLKRCDDRHYMNHIPELGKTALGWELDQPWMGSLRSSRTFGKTGYTGTSILIDPDRSLAVVILSNRTYPRRPHDTSEIMRFRRRVHDNIRS